MNNEEIVDRFGQNLESVHRRIAAAAARSGRSAGDVQLVAVSKYVGAEMTELLVQGGAEILGENRPQALNEKVNSMPDADVQWHLIGHLQRNKVKKVVSQVSLIHSVDSIRLIDAIEKSAGDQSLVVDVLIEVNVSRESAKHGFSPDQVSAALEHSTDCQHVRVRGLMCMAGLGSDSANVRSEFAALRNLRDDLGDPNLVHLSMGMSGDFEVAIEEGATLVRVGSTLFEGIPR